MPTTEIKVPLSHFIAHLAETKRKQLSRRFDNLDLDETGFLMESFRFDDSYATYEPQVSAVAQG